MCVCVCVCVGGGGEGGGAPGLLQCFATHACGIGTFNPQLVLYCEAGGEEAPLGWGVENRHYYVALTSIHCYRIETIVDS